VVKVYFDHMNLQAIHYKLKNWSYQIEHKSVRDE